MTVEFLWTDTCFLTLLALSVLIILLGLRKQHIRHSFNQILQRPIAVSAGIILLFFITIGVLDSIHLTLVKNETQKSPTLLDRILAPIDEISEKTYSAPLALRQFISETALVNGVVTQTYPVLIYPGKSIKTEAEKNKLIKNTIWYALACCLSAAIVIGIFCIYPLCPALKFFLCHKLHSVECFNYFDPAHIFHRARL